MFYPRLRCYGWSIGTRHLPCTKRSFASSIYPYYSPILVARLHGARPSPTRAASTSASRGGIDGRNHKCSHRSYATIVPSAESPKMKLTEADVKRLSRQRNIGVSAHIDSGKTTLTERILFYTGKIREIHEVRGRDQVGAKMDSMELEREKGITIQSAATFCDWDASLPVGFDASPYASPEDISSESAKDAVKKETYAINIIDTPGHVDFTIEVERALRVLDGAILVLCAVSGVQSQTTTVDRQMKRYNVPRISFINKMDRPGANPNRIIQQIRNKLRLSAAAVQVQIGVEDEFRGVVDLVRWKAITFSGDNGMTVTEEAIPDALLPVATEKRQELIATLADLDSEIADLFLEDKEPNTPQLTAAIRRQTLSGKFTPVFLGSAIKNTGVQALLDGVCAYLPGPAEKDVFAHDNTPRSTVFPEAEAENQSAEQEVIPSTSQQSAPQVFLTPASAAPLVALAFKLEEGRFGQLTYMRVYQGSMRKGSVIYNARTGKKVKVPRLVRMHSDELEDIEEIGPGEICAIFGVECASGDTFTDGSTNLSMTSMYVPEPVISLSLKPTGQETPNFSRALNRFQKEDPTFKVHIDPESKETIISGMGELHLQIYVERMKREYNVECVTGKPQVAYRETPTQKVEFSFTHKKQTGGAGQFAKISGYYEPLLQPDGTVEEGSIRRAGDVKDVEFENIVMGGNIPAGYIPAIELGFQDALKKGSLCGGPVTNIRFVLRDGQAHSVDSSELAFKICSIGAFRENYAKMRPVILEPIMNVEVVAPVEFQSNVIGGITARRGTIVDNEVRDDDFTLSAEVPLNDMFGYSSQLRGSTQGKGEFSMEYKNHMPVLPNAQKELEEAYRKTRPQAKK